MSERIAEFLGYLPKVHERTRRLVVLIPPEDMEWTPKPGWFTPGGLVRHLAGIERWMYGETVHGRPSRYPGHGRELAEGLEATLAYYDRLHEESMASFAALTDARMGEKCATPGGTTITVWKWLRAHLEHEAHHRGQLYLMLAMRGVPTPPLYGLTAEEVLAQSR
ncbi:MAG TPA: DinB family protein [Gemmatimonadaceae bacterium]|nr:DinB family protein [Gemmatimonadaceae bacterium]